MRKLIKFLVFTFIACSALCLAAWAYLNSDYAKPWVARSTSEALAKATGSEVSLGTISFSLPFNLTINDTTIGQGDSPWLQAGRICISLSPSEIFKGYLVISKLEIQDVILSKIPVLPKSEDSIFSSASFNFAFALPFSVEEINIRNLSLSEKLLSDLNIPLNTFPKALQLFANIRGEPLLSQLVTEALIGAEDAPEKLLSKLSFSIKQHEGVLSTTFSADELAGGMLSSLTNHYAPGDIHIEGIAASPINALQHLLQSNLPKHNEQALSGKLSVQIGDQLFGEGNFDITSDRFLHLNLHKGFFGPLAFTGSIILSQNLLLDGSQLNIVTDHIEFLEPWIGHSIRGKIDLQCRLNGQFGHIESLIHFQGKQVAYKNMLIETAQGDLQLNQNVEHWDGRLSFKSRLYDHEFQASTKFNWNPERELALSDIVFEAPGSIVQGSLSFLDGVEKIEGKFSGKCSDFSLFETIFSEKLSGDVVFSANLNHTEAEIFIESSKLSLSDSHVENLMFKLSVRELLNQPNGTIFSSIGKITHNSHAAENITFLTSIDSSDQWPFFLSVGMNETEQLSLKTDGNWHLQHSALHCTLNSLSGKVGKTPFELMQPIALDWEAGHFALSPLFLNVDKGSINASVDFVSPLFHSTLHFKDIPLELIHQNSFSPAIHGLVSGNGILNGSLNVPTGQLNVNFHDVFFKEKGFEKIPSLNANMLVNLSENGTSCSGDIITSGHPPIHFYCQIPMAFSLTPFSIHIDKQAPIAGHLKATGEISPILQLFLTDGPSIAGLAEASIAIAGSLDNPQISGAADVTEGSFEIPEIGTLLKNITAHFEGSGSTIVLKKITAFDGRGGSVVGSGNIKMDLESHFPFELLLDINQASIFNQDFATASFNGNLVFKGNTNEASLIGKATAHSATITIPEQTAALMNAVEVTYINQPENEKLPQSFVMPPSAWPLLLDISLSAPGNIAIRGRDLTSEWKGSLSIRGTTETPLFSGELKIVHGKYLFNGKDFRISQGSITFDEDPNIKPNLYVIASKDLDKVKVEVILKGSTKNPAISFRSNPPLPQREILSWILFNRGSSEISPFQGSQLSESITNLKTNQNKGPDVLTKVRNALGIDRFDISRDENNGNAVNVQVGKYISQNIFISLNKSDVNRIAVDAALFPNIKLQAQVGDDSEGQILLKWKHDY